MPYDKMFFTVIDEQKESKAQTQQKTETAVKPCVNISTSAHVSNMAMHQYAFHCRRRSVSLHRSGQGDNSF